MRPAIGARLMETSVIRVYSLCASNYPFPPGAAMYTTPLRASPRRDCVAKDEGPDESGKTEAKGEKRARGKGREERERNRRVEVGKESERNSYLVGEPFAIRELAEKHGEKQKYRQGQALAFNFAV